MDGKKFSIACNIKLDKDHFKKDRTICENCYNRKKRKNNNTLEKVSVNDERMKDRTLSVGPLLSCQTYLMLTLLSQLSNRDIYINTKSPAELYSNSESKL